MKGHILLVEDNEMNRDMLSRRLRKAGYDVSQAVDGKSGVSAALRIVPDLILMDVALGEMDGWETTSRIKADSKTAHVPVIALTAHALESDRRRSVEVGCVEFETKPVDFPRLLRKIEASLIPFAA